MHSFFCLIPSQKFSTAIRSRCFGSCTASFSLMSLLVTAKYRIFVTFLIAISHADGSPCFIACDCRLHLQACPTTFLPATNYFYPPGRPSLLIGLVTSSAKLLRSIIHCIIVSLHRCKGKHRPIELELTYPARGQAIQRIEFQSHFLPCSGVFAHENGGRRNRFRFTE